MTHSLEIQSLTTRKPRPQECEVGSHIVFTAEKQRAMDAGAQLDSSLLCSPKTQAQGMVPHIFRMGFPSQLTKLRSLIGMARG